MAEKANIVTASSFDYRSLTPESRVTVKQKTSEIRDRVGDAAEAARQIGDRLHEVKTVLGRGQFLKWLDLEFQWSETTAQRFMQVATFCKSPKLGDCAPAGIDQSALYLLAQPSTPSEVIEKHLSRSKEGERVTHAEVKADLDGTKSNPPSASSSSDDFDPFADAPEPETAPKTAPTTPAPPPPSRVNNPPAPDAGKGPGKVGAAPAGKGSDPQASTAAESGPVPGKPWDEFNAAIWAQQSALRGVHRELSKILNYDSETKQLRSKWARYYSHHGTLGTLDAIIRALEDGKPVEASSDSPGYVSKGRMKVVEGFAKARADRDARKSS